MKMRTMLSVGLFLSGLCILGYYWSTLYDRGISADTNGTAGYTTGLEMALIALGMVLLVTGLFMFMKSFKSIRRKAQ